MVFITAHGNVTEKRSLFRLSIFGDLFWSMVNGFGLFIMSIFSPIDPKTRRPAEKKAIGQAPAFGRKSSKGGGRSSKIRGIDDVKKQLFEEEKKQEHEQEGEATLAVERLGIIL